MKKLSLVIIALASVFMTSCLKWGSNYTPKVSVTAFITASGDTLYSHYEDKNKSYILDTIQVGDTAFFLIYNQSFANNLVSSYVSWDTTYLKMWTQLSDSFKVALLPTSDIDALRFDYQNGYNQTVIPVRALPLKAGRTKLYFYVSSDSDYKDSDGTLELIIRE